MKKDKKSVAIDAVPININIDSKELKQILTEQVKEIHEKTEEKLEQSRAVDKGGEFDHQPNRFDHGAYYRGGLNE